MQGILARGEHRLAMANGLVDAWAFLRRNPGTDLLFTGLQLAGNGSGLDLIHKLRADPSLQHLPVVVYTGHGDRDSVRQAMALHVQNFLVKPYHDDDIFAEIDKALADPWRNRFFEEEKSFCRMMRLTPEQLHGLLADLHRDLVAARDPLAKAAEARDPRAVANLLSPLARQAEAAGVWCVVEALGALSDHAGVEKWGAWPAAFDTLDFGTALLASRLDPEHAASPDFLASLTPAEDPYARERKAWLAAPAEDRCPVVPAEQLLREAADLRGCPIIDSAAAGFQMIANGHPSCINPLMDLVARDPGLTAQMLIAANIAHPPKPGDNPIEDARLAVGQLGEVRLEALARNLLVVTGQVMNLPPGFDWPRYWTFQRGVARIAQVICHELEFYSLEPAARVAGQLHDIGRLILAHLRPAGFQAILEHARVHGLRLHEAERLFVGCTTNHLGASFGEKAGLPRRFVNVIRGMDDPGAATEDRHLVAVVSLARKLCRQNQVGASGDVPLASARPIKDTPQWAILSEGLYPSFNLEKFETQIHAQCVRLCTEFSGHQAGTVGELVGSGTA